MKRFLRELGPKLAAYVVVGGALIGSLVFAGGLSYTPAGFSGSYTGNSTFTGDMVITGTSDLRGAVSDSAGDLQLSDTVEITGTLEFTTTNATASITSATADATTSGTVAAMTFAPTADITGTDLAFEWNDSGGNSLLSLTEAGVLTVNSSITTGSSITVNNAGVLATNDLAAHIGSSTNTFLDAYIKNFYDQGGTGRMIYDVFDGTRYYGNAINDGATYAHKFANSTTLSTVGAAGIIGIYSDDQMTTLQARVGQKGFWLQPEQTVTVADDGAGTAPASTITPTSSEVDLAYNDADNASVGTLSETGAQAGSTVYILHTGSGGTVAFAASAGVFVTGATCTLSSGDMLVVKYRNSAWQRIACIDNTP